MRYEAYKTANSATEKPIQTEYRLFAEITRELELAMSLTATANDQINAAFRNSQLWLTLRADLSSEHNHLAPQLKAGLISLAIWVEKHSLLAIHRKADLAPLIEVNKDIMQGLSKSGHRPRLQPSTAPNMDVDQVRQAMA